MDSSSWNKIVIIELSGVTKENCNCPTQLSRTEAAHLLLSQKCTSTVLYVYLCVTCVICIDFVDRKVKEMDNANLTCRVTGRQTGL